MSLYEVGVEYSRFFSLRVNVSTKSEARQVIKSYIEDGTTDPRLTVLSEDFEYDVKSVVDVDKAAADERLRQKIEDLVGSLTTAQLNNLYDALENQYG